MLIAVITSLVSLATGAVLLGRYLKETWEKRKTPSIQHRIDAIAYSIRESHGEALKETQSRLKNEKDVLELISQEEKKVFQSIQSLRDGKEKEQRELLVSKAAAEAQERKNEIRWFVWSPYGPISDLELIMKLYGKAVSKLNDIQKAIQQVDATISALDNGLKEARKRIALCGSQLSLLANQSKMATSAATGQLREFLDNDPRLVKLRIEQNSSHWLEYVMQFLHTLTGSLFLLVGAKAALRSLQLASLFRPHVLVPQHGTN